MNHLGILVLLLTALMAGDHSAGWENQKMRVSPTTFETQAAMWTYLVVGIEEESTTVALLVLDGRKKLHPISRHVTKWGSLYSFRGDDPPIAAMSAAALDLVIGRKTLRFNLTLLSDDVPPQTQVAPGRLMVRLKPHALAWHGAPERNPAPRSLEDVPCNDPVLANLMRAVEVSAIAKIVPWLDDGDSLLADGRIVLPPSLRSSYVLVFPSTHSPLSIGAILSESPSVLETSWEPVVSSGW